MPWQVWFINYPLLFCKAHVVHSTLHMVALCKSQSSASLKQLVKAQEHYIVLREMCQLPPGALY